MLVLKLIWISLLLLLCQNGVDARILQICERGTSLLTCDTGFIKVLKANYGRTDRRTCSNGIPANQLSNIHCFRDSTLTTMSTRCDGRKSCSVPAANSVFSDPCPGIHKYLNLTYDCIPAKSTIICEHSKGVIACDTGVISIHHANYGRRELVICHKPSKTSNCYSPQTTSLRSRCNGKTSCQLQASNSVFSDPCFRVIKYLEVTYSCK